MTETDYTFYTEITGQGDRRRAGKLTQHKTVLRSEGLCQKQESSHASFQLFYQRGRVRNMEVWISECKRGHLKTGHCRK